MGVSSTEVDRIVTPTPARQADWLGQATAIEQARAVAEVQAAIVVAQQCPRDVPAATAAMREACSQGAMADRAFFRYNRGGGSITGPTIHLARELARCWGNIQYGIAELRRDDAGGVSEMQAYAWDVQTNTRSAQIFIVPHRRDKKGVAGGEKLVELRDVYENNANQGARRVREAIFAVLPMWFTEAAKELCSDTLRKGGGKPLAELVADAVRWMGSLGISEDQLTQKYGPKGKWNEYDVAQLRITYTSIQQGTVNKDDEFPPRRVTAAEVTAAAPAPAGGRAGQEPAPQPDDAGGWPATPEIAP